MKFKEQKVYVESFVLALAITLFVLSIFWYYNVYTGAQENALQSIEEIRAQCDALVLMDAACELEENSYDASMKILCGPEMEAALSDLEVNVKGSYDRWEVQALHEGKLGAQDALDFNKNTINEVEMGSCYFLRVYRDKLSQLFGTGALVKSCSTDEEKLKEYVECDLMNAEKVLPSEKRPLADEYYEQARNSIEGEDYVSAAAYITGAVAFQDEVARTQYENFMLSEDGPYCR